MEHHFNIHIAQKVGVNAAVVFHNLYFWCLKNEKEERHIYDNRAWTYASQKAMGELFPYLTEKMIRTALDKLKDYGLILVGNFNENGYDRTKWYSISDKGKELLEGRFHSPQKANRIDPKGEPIPYSKPYKKLKDYSSLPAEDERKSSDLNKKNLQNKVADRVIQTLNKMTGKRYQNTQANRKHILARINEGYKLKDFIQVIKTKRQDPYFVANPKYLRPETLFGAKFDTYLNESPDEYSDDTRPSKKSGNAAPPKNPFDPKLTKPFEDFLDDPSPANLAQLYRNLQGIEKWVQGIDFDAYKNHTVVYSYYRRWKDYAEKLLQWIDNEGWIGKHPSVFDIEGKIWKQFCSKCLLPEVYGRDRIKMKWDKY